MHTHTQTLRAILGLAQYTLRVFALTLLAVELGYGLLLAGLAFWLAYDGSMLKGILAASSALLLVCVLGILLAVQFTALLTIRRAIATTQVGKAVFDQLFERALGISDEHPEGTSTLTANVHGMPVDKVKAALNEAADSLLEHEEVEASVPGVLLWLAARIQRILVWATVQVIIKQCSTQGSNPTVDLVKLRDRLAGVIDTLIADWLKQHVTKIAWAAAVVTTSLAGLTACGIRFLPI